MKPLSFCVDQFGDYRPDLDRARTLSPKANIRFDAAWRWCSDHTGTRWNWTELDHKFNEAETRGLRPHLMVAMWCPDDFLKGVSTDYKWQIRTQAALDGHTEFCHQLGLRYGTRVRTVELGNELNLKKPFAPDGSDPLWQAKVCATVSHAFPSSWRLTSPGMAPASTGGGYLSPYDFLKVFWPEYIRQGGAPLRGCCIHPYGRAADASQSWSVLGALGKIHDLVKVPILATEYNSNWNTTDADKAKEIPVGLDYLASRGFVERTFLYAMSDPSTDRGVHLGLCDGADRPRPQYNAVEAWVGAH